MKILYVILFHKNPQQLLRLVNRLEGEDTFFIIHICKNTPENDVQEAKDWLRHKQNLFYCRRERVTWGSYKLTKAILKAINLAFEKNLQFDYFSLLSAQDYPIKNRREIVSFLEDHKGTEFLTFFPMDKTTSGEPYFDPITQRESFRNQVHRYQHRNIHIRKNNYVLLPGEYDPSASGLSGKMRNLAKKTLRFVKRRKLPLGLNPYFGSGWFTITYECTKFIHDFVKSNPGFFRFMKQTWCTDEMFFQTVILHSKFKEKTVNDNLRLILWKEEGSKHPAFLTKEDFDEISASEKLFARKFDTSRDSDIFDMIDELTGMQTEDQTAFHETTANH